MTSDDTNAQGRKRNWKGFAVLALVLFVLGVAGWNLARPTVLKELGPPVDVIADLLTPGLTERVVLISIDGLRPDAIDQFGASAIQKIRDNGRYSMRATTIIPAKTLPSHASMLTGVQPAVHGLTWNEDMTGEHGFVKVPTIFGIARPRGFETAAFFSKTKFEHLALPADFDFIQRPRGGVLNIFAGFAAQSVTTYLADHKPNLLFVHLADVDFTGHRVGWMSYLYGRALRGVDNGVRSIVVAANKAFGCGNYTLIITADHGGHGTNHGDNVPSDMLIPWIAFGKGVNGTGVITDSINTTDTAASVLWLLGIDPVAPITGRVVRQAFKTAAGPGIIPELPDAPLPGTADRCLFEADD